MFHQTLPCQLRIVKGTTFGLRRIKENQHTYTLVNDVQRSEVTVNEVGV